MNNLRRSAALAAAVLGGLAVMAGPASAEMVVMSFDSVGGGSTGTVLVFDEYREAGFTLTPPTGSGFNSFGPDSGFFYAGSRGLSPFDAGQITTLTEDDGTTFSLLSIDLAKNFAFDENPAVLFTGTKADGSLVFQAFATDNPPGVAEFETFTFTGFTDLRSVSWAQGAAPFAHQFDNIVLEPTVAAVPEPSGLVLAGIGAIGGALLARRRRRPC
jgi:hypothetical protein